jgi:hypothetical protein
MTDLLRPHLDSFVVVYLDDILIYSPDPSSHDRHVRAILEILRQNQLYAKESKCDFFKDRIEFLGHVITPNGVAMEPEKIAAISAWPTPSSVSDIRSFLGLAGFYRRFIPKFSDIASPLTDMLCKDTPFEWTAASQAAIDTLKEYITTAPILAIPSADPKHSWSLSTDASNFAVGGVLSQDCGHGYRPVAFRSRKMSPAERNYPVHDKEMLAIIDCIRAWRCYLQSRHVTIWTDHCSLSFFDSQPKLA